MLGDLDAVEDDQTGDTQAVCVGALQEQALPMKAPLPCTLAQGERSQASGIDKLASGKLRGDGGSLLPLPKRKGATPVGGVGEEERLRRMGARLRRCA